MLCLGTCNTSEEESVEQMIAFVSGGFFRVWLVFSVNEWHLESSAYIGIICGFWQSFSSRRKPKQNQ